MICEELALSLSRLSAALPEQTELVAAVERCRGLLLSAERSIHAVQDRNTSSVKAQLQQFIPQDFRGALLESKRVASEARYKKQIDDLVKRGGTIRQKYDLYLQQQWERRQALVQLGECSGMFKMLIKFLAGIPQVLLDFAKEINAKLGPMEEQRIKYGPDLYGVTTLGIRLDVCLAAWAENAAAPAGHAAAAAAGRLAEVVEPAVIFYCEHMLRVIRFIGDVFQHSPFFVNKDDLDAHGAGGGAPAAHHAGSEVAGGAGKGATAVCAVSSSSSVVAGQRSYDLVASSGEAEGNDVGAAAALAPTPAPEAGAAVEEQHSACPVTQTNVVPVPAGKEVLGSGGAECAQSAPLQTTVAVPGSGPAEPQAGTAVLMEPMGSLPSPPSTPRVVAGLPVCPSSGRDTPAGSLYSSDPRDLPGLAQHGAPTNFPSPLGPGVGAGVAPGAAPSATGPPASTANVTATSVAIAAAAAASEVLRASQGGATADAQPAVRSQPPATERRPVAAAGSSAPQAPPPRRPAPLVHVDTPSPHNMAPWSGGSLSALHARESVSSFRSAEEEQPWHRPEEVFPSPTSLVGGLLGCFGRGGGGGDAGHQGVAPLVSCPVKPPGIISSTGSLTACK